MPPRKRFGQHFLCSPIFVTQVLNALGPVPDQHIVEIGPGEGALTIPLLKQGHHLSAIEIDRELAAKLRRSEYASNRLHMFCEDALQFDFAALARTKPLRLLGNLPYNISTPLLFHLLNFYPYILDMHFMLQREVAYRLIARAGDAEYSRLSVVAQCFFDTFILFDIPASAFHPAPQVVSSFVRMKPLPDAPIAVLSDLDEMVKRAFSQRRKSVAKVMSPLFDHHTLERMGIDPHSRPDTLQPSDFLRMVKYTS